MHGDGDKVFSKDFSKTPLGATYARGDDELGSHLMTKWCTKASVCVVFKTDWFKLRPLFQPYMRNHSTLIWERALLIT